MQVNHLAHSDRSIKCKGCGTEFEVPMRVLSDPEALVFAKESIAAKHTCKARKDFSSVRLMKFPAGNDLSAYWSNEMRRLMPAQS